MMSIIDLYIGRMILATTTLSLSVLVGLSGLIKFVEQLRYVGRGSFDTSDAAMFVLFSIPRDIEMFFPMGVLLGGLIGLGMLASNSELTVMQASGLSRFNIIASAMKTVLLLMLVVTALGEFVAPAAERHAREMRSQALSGGSLLRDANGLWARDGDRFVHIQQLLEADQLGDVTLYEFKDRKLTLMLHAERATWQDEGWHLEEVKETRIDAGGTSTTSRASAVMGSELTPDKLGVVTVKPEALSLQGLLQYLDYLENNRQDASRYWLAFWRKLLSPLTLAVMLLVACSFVFGPLRSVTMGARVLLGVITGFGFFLSSEIFGPISLVYEVPPVLGASLPSLLFIGLSVWLLRRQA
ncbi:LPS export ABC transporter permease LptG [Gallaecimonas sp. GXIMD4217]|uniref:LPS export ABC transporter permease LptG n=1 Tax=Gallaecimonas sp. GXIMD4217 TaxID=3131927 RepID=UPI00311AEDBA